MSRLGLGLVIVALVVGCGETGRVTTGGPPTGRKVTDAGRTMLDGGPTVATSADIGLTGDAGLERDAEPAAGEDSGVEGPADSGPSPSPDVGPIASPDASTTRDSGVPQPNPDSGVPQPNPDSGVPQTNPDAGTPVPVGNACSGPAQCSGGSCLNGTVSWWSVPFTGGYCTVGGCSGAGSCPSGSSCVGVDQMGTTTCLADCTGQTCRPGYTCHASAEVCVPGTPGTGASPVGGACTQDGDCRGTGAECIPENGASFTGGYCTIFGCNAQSPCPSGSECYTVNAQGQTACLASCTTRSMCRAPAYACQDPGACLPACTATSCDTGEMCGAQGTCVPQACTATSCGSGLVCDSASGQCVVNVGTPPAGPVPTCSVPAWQCTGTSAFCSEIIAFTPVMGSGYWNYPLNGETSTNQYRSYLRRDVVMLIQYAAASVACLAQRWTVGNGLPLGLGDMSEANGAIPGTSRGSPGHPPGTHEQGRDLDIAYYQLNPPDNTLRAICPYTSGGADQNHCVGAPNNLDVWRTALFLGKLHDSNQLRVIGVDGRVGPLVSSALTQLCAGGWLNNSACRNPAVTYETTDMGRGWYYFHHHHFHVSTSGVRNFAPPPPVHERCLLDSCRPARHDTHAHPPRANITLAGPRLRLE